MRLRTRFSTVLLVAALAAILVPVASAQTSYWSDPAGDAPAGAPDLTTTAASIDTNGLLTWNISTTAVGAFGTGTAVSIRLDTDGSAATGWEGGDYSIVVANGYVGLYRWNGSSFDLVPDAPGVTATLGFPETVTLNASAIGSPRTVRFQVWTYGSAPYYENTADVAPSATSWYGLDTGNPNQAPSTPTTQPTAPPASSPDAPATTPAPAVPAPTGPATDSSVPGAPAGPTAPAPTTPASAVGPSTPARAPVSAPAHAPKTLPAAPAAHAPEMRSTTTRLTGKTLVVTARFTGSLAGATGSCSVGSAHRHFGTLRAKVKGQTVTCWGVFSHGPVPRTFQTVLTLKVHGTRQHLTVPFAG